MMREVKKRTNIWGGVKRMEEQRKKILIVDDSEMNREILVSMLEDEYDLIQAEDGQQAVYIRSEHHME